MHDTKQLQWKCPEPEAVGKGVTSGNGRRPSGNRSVCELEGHDG